MKNNLFQWPPKCHLTDLSVSERTDVHYYINIKFDVLIFIIPPKNNINKMESLSKDLIIKTAVELPIYDVLNLCQTNKKFWQKLCHNSTFWQTRAIEVLGYKKEDLPEKIDQQWYLGHAGTVYGQGNNDNNQLALKGTAIEEPKLIIDRIKKIYCNENVSAFIDGDDNLYVTGDNKKFQFVTGNVKQVTSAGLSENETVLFHLLTNDGDVYVFDMDDALSKDSDKVHFDERNLKYVKSNVRYIYDNYLINGNVYLDTYSGEIERADDIPNDIKFLSIYSGAILYITKDNKLYFNVNHKR